MLAPEDIGKNLKKWQNKPVAGVIDGILQRLCKKLRQRLDALEKGKDPEALHDARVEIKRLRVWLKHSRPVLKTRKKGRKMLKAFTQASNPLRDLEVMLAWLEQLEANSNRAPGGKGCHQHCPAGNPDSARAGAVDLPAIAIRSCGAGTQAAQVGQWLSLWCLAQ